MDEQYLVGVDKQPIRNAIFRILAGVISAGSLFVFWPSSSMLPNVLILVAHPNGYDRTIVRTLDQVTAQKFRHSGNWLTTYLPL